MQSKSSNNSEDKFEEKKKEYIEFFQWLFSPKEIEIIEEIDFTLCHDHDNPNIYYPKTFKAFLESDPMQRLGRIFQLKGPNNFTINLSHSRFEHSLGVYHWKLEELINNFKNEEWKKYVEDNNAKIYLIAELIKMLGHDIGHSFFSHIPELYIVGHKRIS